MDEFNLENIEHEFCSMQNIALQSVIKELESAGKMYADAIDKEEKLMTTVNRKIRSNIIAINEAISNLNLTDAKEVKNMKMLILKLDCFEKIKKGLLEEQDTLEESYKR